MPLLLFQDDDEVVVVANGNGKAHAESPTSVLSDEVPYVPLFLKLLRLIEIPSQTSICDHRHKGLTFRFWSFQGASVASDDAPTVTEVVTEKMLEEEKRLADERAKKEAEEAEALLKAAPNMDESSFSKLDQLLNQTKIYSQFLLERMDDIAMVGVSYSF